MLALPIIRPHPFNWGFRIFLQMMHSYSVHPMSCQVCQLDDVAGAHFPVRSKIQVHRKHKHSLGKLIKPVWGGYIQGREKSLQILLSYSQAGPGRKVKQGQEEISRNHVPTFFLGSAQTNFSSLYKVFKLNVVLCMTDVSTNYLISDGRCKKFIVNLRTWVASVKARNVGGKEHLLVRS